MNKINIQSIIAITQQAAQRIMAIYNQSHYAVNQKTDHTPLTEADMESHHLITSSLAKLYPSIPIISEEATELHDYAIRKNWESFFLVDPLDGTKEFIGRNGEFTINIALIQHGQPILGVINAPALQVIYHAELGKGAYKIEQNQQIPLLLQTQTQTNAVCVAISRSHQCEKTHAFIEKLRNSGKDVSTLAVGSALKFGLVAEGKADFYPRLTPTMEWDTAAGHILVNEVGKKVTLINNDELLQYNKIELRNSGFIVQ
jgi:3'(2'), 5'-bisphosphate nucleotidase